MVVLLKSLYMKSSCYLCWCSPLSDLNSFVIVCKHICIQVKSLLEFLTKGNLLISFNRFIYSLVHRIMRFKTCARHNSYNFCVFTDSRPPYQWELAKYDDPFHPFITFHCLNWCITHVWYKFTFNLLQMLATVFVLRGSKTLHVIDFPDFDRSVVHKVSCDVCTETQCSSPFNQTMFIKNVLHTGLKRCFSLQVFPLPLLYVGNQLTGLFGTQQVK